MTTAEGLTGTHDAAAPGLRIFRQQRPKVGLFVGAMEWYWTMTGMGDLRDAVVRDGRRLATLLEEAGASVTRKWTWPFSTTGPTSTTK
jgi:hypothetical protein